MRSLALCLIALLAASVFSLFAQNEASLSGTVQDASGGVLPQATVKLTSHDQGTTRTAQTNGAGVYQFSFLPAGVYNLEITAAGFKTLTRTDLTLAAAQNARYDFNLEVGSVTENITVSAAVENVNTESADLGAVVDNTRVVEMPLNGRMFWSLPLLTPGVMPPVQGSGLGYRGGFNVAGSCEGCNTFTLNGFDNNDNTKAIPGFRPSIDAIQEFNVITGVYGAQYGYASGGQITMITKSGTNQLHGSAFDFIRNQAILTARNFFALPLAPLPAFNRNQFGATIGGPILKNKTFFFISYEGLRLSQGVISLTTVPTQAMLAGDFSSLLPGRTIKDPTTNAPFPGNIIPGSRINPIGQALVNYYPAPSFPTPAGAAPANNYDFSEPRTENMNEGTVKLDHTFSSKDSMFATANFYNDPSVEHGNTPVACTSEDLPGFNCDYNQRYELYGLSETHIFSPSLVNESRYGFTMSVNPSSPVFNGVHFWDQFGIQPVVESPYGLPALPHWGIPGTTITGYQNLSGSGNFERDDPHWQFADTVSWTYRKHTIKFGSGMSWFQSNNSNVGNSTGTLTFTNTSTGPTSGYALADLLLGLPATTGNQPYVNKLYLRERNIFAFVQDDYKVSSSLTLNVGLRWEENTPPVDLGGHEINFDVAKGIPVIQGSSPYLFYQPDGLGNTVLKADLHDFAPRFGFAWQPFHDGKTVVRGGAGTFLNNPSFYNGLSGIYAAYPETFTYSSSVAQPVSLSNPFPSSNAVITPTLIGAFPQFTNARVYEWSLGVQRQLTQDMLAELTYVGESGSHLNQSQNINQPAPGPGTPAQVNARRPYPNYGTISYVEFDGNSHFESLQAKLQKRYGYGLSFLASYTFSKSIDDVGASGGCSCGAGPTNQYDFRTARGLSAFDVRHRVVLSPVYELPFGKGKPFLSNGVAALIAGGWQLSTLVQWQTGAPLTATLSGNYSNSGGSTDRPDLIGDPNANAPHTPQEWFNTSAFALRPASGQPGATYSFGNEGKGVIVGPGLVQADLSIVRNFQVREWMKVQFRAEFFNLFNHVNFNFPGVVADTSTFGTITGALDPRETQLALKITF